MTEIILIILTPVIGGLIYGIERVVRARMQNRQGPPVLQPFYDMYKLMDKQPFIINNYHIVFAIMHLITLWTVVGMIILGYSLLYIVFLHLLASIFLVLAGYSVNSVYSHIGSNRELIAIVAYEPILILIAIGFYIHNGTFEISYIYENGVDFTSMFLLFLSLVLIIPIKLKKSPFDAVEAHQEIVGGVEIEYSGIFFEILYMAKWIEYVFIYLLVYLFVSKSLFIAFFICAGVFLLVNLVDNSTARIRITDMVKITLILGLGLGILNLAGLAYV